MKNFVRSIMCAVAFLCCTAASAQLTEGDNGVGVNFGYMTGSNGISNVGLGLKYNYMITESLRAEANGMYYFKSGKNETDWFDVNLNAHYLFNVAEKTYIYPIFGFSTMFGHTSFSLGEKVPDFGIINIVTDEAEIETRYSDRHFRFGVNLGFGGQYDITDDFALTLEAKYKLTKDFSNFNIALGCVVLF